MDFFTYRILYKKCYLYGLCAKFTGVQTVYSHVVRGIQVVYIFIAHKNSENINKCNRNMVKRDSNV